MIVETNGKIVVGTTPSEAAVGQFLVQANLRETKGKQVPDELRYRNISLPEFDLQDACSDKYRPILRASFERLAKLKFEGIMEDNRSLRLIPVEEFTIPALLEFASAEALSQRITGEAVGVWFDSSATRTYIVGKANEEKAAKFRALYVKLASPNHGVNPQTATALMATMQEADTGDRIAEFLVGKCQAVVKRSEASEVDAL